MVLKIELSGSQKFYISASSCLCWVPGDFMMGKSFGPIHEHCFFRRSKCLLLIASYTAPSKYQLSNTESQKAKQGVVGICQLGYTRLIRAYDVARHHTIIARSYQPSQASITGVMSKRPSLREVDGVPTWYSRMAVVHDDAVDSVPA